MNDRPIHPPTPPTNDPPNNTKEGTMPRGLNAQEKISWLNAIGIDLNRWFEFMRDNRHKGSITLGEGGLTVSFNSLPDQVRQDVDLINELMEDPVFWAVIMRQINPPKKNPPKYIPEREWKPYGAWRMDVMMPWLENHPDSGQRETSFVIPEHDCSAAPGRLCPNCEPW